MEQKAARVLQWIQRPQEQHTVVSRPLSPYVSEESSAWTITVWLWAAETMCQALDMERYYQVVYSAAKRDRQHK
jgi:hypothetical protein